MLQGEYIADCGHQDGNYDEDEISAAFGLLSLAREPATTNRLNIMANSKLSIPMAGHEEDAANSRKTDQGLIVQIEPLSSGTSYAIDSPTSPVDIPEVPLTNGMDLD